MIRRIFTEEEVFDLELKAHGRVQYDLGRSDERGRIIAVLEKMSDTASSTKTKAGTQTVWVIENAIALIKGENK